MRHILVLSTSYPDDIPGSEAAGSFVEDFVLELSKRVRVTVITASKMASVSTFGNITVRRFSAPKLPLSLLKPYLPNHWFAIFITLIRGYRATAAITRSEQPDHIFALWTLPCGGWAKAAGKKNGVPYSTWALGSDIWSLGKIPLVRTKLRHVLAGASSCFADGYLLKDEVEALSARRCYFLPSTRNIDSNVHTSTSGNKPYNLAFLGRWHHNKGPDILLDALALLTESDWKRINEVRFFGGGPMESDVRKKVDALKCLGKPITLGGYLDKVQAVDLIAWADYLMVPSRIESIPVIFSDAVKVGTPMVATPVGDLKLLYSRYRYGILATEANYVAYCEAIKSAINENPSVFDPGLKKARGDFNLSKIVDTFLSHCGFEP